MSLVYTGGDTDRVDHGSDASLDNINTMTALAWVFIETETANNVVEVVAHKGVGPTPESAYLQWAKTSNTARYRVVKQRETSNLQVLADASAFSVHGLNKDLFFVSTWNTTGSNSDQKIYLGDRSTPAAEPSSYVTQEAGSGAATNDAADPLSVGGDSGGRSLDGRISYIQIISVALTEAEIHKIQFSPLYASRHSSAVLFVPDYGISNGTGTQRDLSGNGNDGTVTGAVVGEHVPRPMIMSSRHIFSSILAKDAFAWNKRRSHLIYLRR